MRQKDIYLHPFHFLAISHKYARPTVLLVALSYTDPVNPKMPGEKKGKSKAASKDDNALTLALIDQATIEMLSSNEGLV